MGRAQPTEFTAGHADSPTLRVGEQPWSVECLDSISDGWHPLGDVSSEFTRRVENGDQVHHLGLEDQVPDNVGQARTKGEQSLSNASKIDCTNGESRTLEVDC
ncbi:MAG: hypothetical protein ACI8QC_003119 [Planctomycetota bacterium]|jgi:hypothetical protein